MRQLTWGVSLAALFAACGGDRVGDALVSDATPADDAAMVDDATAGDDAPLSGAIRVVVREFDGQPLAGQTVMFQHLDDGVIATIMTGADGVAEANVDGPTNVSSFGSSGSLKLVNVWLEAQPGDVLEVGGREPIEQPFTGTVTLVLPPTAGGFTVSTRCSSNSADGGVSPTLPTAITISACGSPTNFLVSSSAGRFYTPQMTLTPGQTIDLTGETYRKTLTHTISVANSQSTVTVTASSSDAGMELMPNQSLSVGGNSSPGFTMYDLPTVPITSDVQAGGPLNLTQWTRRRPPGNQVFEWSALGLPNVSDPVFEKGMLTWTEDGSGGDYVMAYAGITNAGLTRLLIKAVGPKSGTMLRVPMYPPPYSEYNAQSDDLTNVRSASVLRSTGGWHRARRVFFRADFWTLGWLDDGELVIRQRVR